MPNVALQALGVDVSPEQLVSTLSPAQKQLVEIARVMKGEPRVVILDEPTSSLASAEVELVISAGEKMSALGVAVTVSATGWKKSAALPPVPPLCAMVRWRAM